MLTFISTIFSTITKYTSLIKYIGIFIVVSILAYNIYSFYNQYEKLKIDNDMLTIAIKSTRLELSKAVMTANQNAEELRKVKIANEITLENLTENHKKELANKEKYTVIKERTYYEKDSDFISPVLRNTIDRLYPAK